MNETVSTLMYAHNLVPTQITENNENYFFWILSSIVKYNAYH